MAELRAETGDKSDLSKEIRKEIENIEDMISFKEVKSAEECFDKLSSASKTFLETEKSDIVLGESEKIFYSFDLGIMNTKYTKDLRSIGKKMEEMKKLVLEVQGEECGKIENLESERMGHIDMVNHSVNAVNTYQTTMDSNRSLVEEKVDIMNDEHGLIKENERLVEKSEKPDATIEQRVEMREKIVYNGRTVQSKMAQRPLTNLPERYTDMKKQLKGISSLHKLNNRGRRDG